MRGLIVAALLGLAAIPAKAIDPDWMECYDPDGSVEGFPIEGAQRVAGGLRYSIEGSPIHTTRPCIANLGGSAKTTQTPNDVGLAMLGRSSIVCQESEEYVGYDGIASSATLLSGVWTWTEETTGHRYLSTAPCTAHHLFAP